MADNDSISSSFNASVFDQDDDVSDIEDLLAQLKVTLKSSDFKYKTERAQQIVERALPLCPSQLLDEKIFCEILPVFYRITVELMQEIDEILNAKKVLDVLGTVKEKLLICEEFLGLWQKCVDYVASLRQVSVSDVRTLPDVLPEIIKIVFGHCKNSQQSYGKFLEGASKELTSLFRKANAILKLFLATLEGVIVFDTDVESETELLVKVIGLVGEIATMTNGMDLKTSVEASKVFGKLAINHQEVVKKLSPASVTNRLTEITRNSCLVLSTFKESASVIEERMIKATSLMLKVLNKLIKIYCVYLDSEFLVCIIELLLEMQRCIPSCLKLLEINEKVIDVINVHITTGNEPLLNAIFNHTDFKQTYFEYGSRPNIDKLSYHLLTIGIMNILIDMPYDHQCKWTVGSDSVLDVALTNIHCIQEELCAAELRVAGAYELGERPRLATIYEATLVPICGLISQVPPNEFHAVELLLLKHLLSGQLWSSLLSSDIWCFIGRLGSSDLCADHVRYLIKVHTALASRQNSLELIVLKSLIERLYTLLSDEMKHQLVVESNMSDVSVWISIARCLPIKTKSFLKDRLGHDLSRIPKILEELRQRATVQNWTHLITFLDLAGKLCSKETKESIGVVSTVWNFIANTIEECEDRQLDIISELIRVSLDCIRPESISEDILSSIFENIIASLLYMPSHAKIRISHYLTENVDSFDHCGSKVSMTLADLNARLLEDKNPWVQQDSLESFDYIAHMCGDENLVATMATAIAKKPSVSNAFRCYLSNREYYRLNGFASVQIYLRHLTRVAENAASKHVCPRYNDTWRNEKLARTRTTPRGNEELDERVNKICQELNEIVKRKQDVSSHMLQKLRTILDSILEPTGCF